jgi:hypothetical protein
MNLKPDATAHTLLAAALEKAGVHVKGTWTEPLSSTLYSIGIEYPGIHAVEVSGDDSGWKLWWYLRNTITPTLMYTLAPTRYEDAMAEQVRKVLHALAGQAHALDMVSGLYI